MDSPTVVPKKFYRHFLKGLAYHSFQRNKVCSHDELLAYVYLKNNQQEKLDKLESMSHGILDQFVAHGLVTEVRGGYRMNETLRTPPSELPSSSGIGDSVRTPRSNGRKRKQTFDERAYDGMEQPELEGTSERKNPIGMGRLLSDTDSLDSDSWHTERLQSESGDSQNEEENNQEPVEQKPPENVTPPSTEVNNSTEVGKANSGDDDGSSQVPPPGQASQ